MPAPWDDAQLDVMRLVADPVADHLAADLVEREQVGAISRVWRTLRANDEPVPSGLPPSVRAYLNTTALPPWADPERIAVGEDVFAKHGPAIVTGLFCASLPIGYSCAPPAHVLVQTGKLVRHVHHRIDETAQLVFDVTAPGGLTSPHGRGVRTCQKVRVIHAAIRHRLLAETSFDTSRFGVPINQEDLAATVLAFGHVTAWVVERQGATLSDHEREGWLHLWRVVGALLGTLDSSLPDGHADCAALYRAVLRRHQAPTAAGRELTLALLHHIRSYLPGRLDDAVFAELMRDFLSEPVADWMSVPRHPRARGLLSADRWLRGALDAITDRSPRLALIAGRTNRHLLQALHFADRRGKATKFRIPERLRRRRQR